MLWTITCVDTRDTAVLHEHHTQIHRACPDRQKSILVLGGATLTDSGEHATGSVFIVNVYAIELTRRPFRTAIPFIHPVVQRAQSSPQRCQPQPPISRSRLWQSGSMRRLSLRLR